MPNPFFTKASGAPGAASDPSAPGTDGPASSVDVVLDSQGANATSPRVEPPQSVDGVPKPGEILASKYRVERVLGIGGMGVVVSAIHLDLDERVAVKFLLPQAPGAQSDAVARFVREGKAAIKIRSDHVVRVLDSGKLDSGTPYMVMEFLDGRDLHAILETDGPLPIEQAVDYLLQACDAVAAAHSIGIIHRDLKPGNLFLTRRADGTPFVKVLDFGISKIISDNPASSGLTSTTAIMGTPAFMPPEQLRSTRHVDARADIWSLGTILYAFLTGEPPYSGESTADIAAKIIRDPPPPLRSVRLEVPEALEAVVLRCLEKEPAARYPGVAELAEGLLPFASEASRASAGRLAKQISSRQLGHAPTLRSDAPPALQPKSGNGATRTANAWGEARRESERPSGRKGLGFFAAIAATGAAVAGAVMALVMPHAEPATPRATAATTLVAPPPAVPIVTPIMPPAPVPTAVATILAPNPAPSSAVSSSPVSSSTPAPAAAPPASSRGARPPRATAPAGHAKSSPGAAPPATPAAAPSATSAGGLFDDRE